MTVKIDFTNPKGEIIGSAIAEDNKSISQIAEKNGIEIPISCCHGACMVCNCKIKTGAEHIQIDKITSPSVLPRRDLEGNRTDVLTCVGGIKSESIKDQETYIVTLEKIF